MLKQLRIGSLTLPNNILLAPLAGITNLPFRIICRNEGASLAFTEMISVNGLVREGPKTFDLLKSCPEDRPLGIQLFGDSLRDLAEAARMVEDHGDLIDINMGCPVRKVVATGAGSALLQDPLKIAAIIREVRKTTKKPLTIKIRSGWRTDEPLFHEIGMIAANEGCDAITLHPRSRGQMFSGTADWNQLKALKESVPIPVIGSGDLFTPGDCLKMLAKTGCDGIMVARGALGAPWIFRQITELQSRGSLTPVKNSERGSVISRHFELYQEQFGATVALREMKKHISWYAKGFAGAADIRREVNMARSKEEIYSIADRISGMPDAATTT